MKAIEAKVFGTVQGVGFRMFVYRQAERLGLFGWVKNCRDGSVELCCEGSDVELDYFLQLIKRGNDFSKVDKVEVKDIEPSGYSTFEVYV